MQPLRRGRHTKYCRQAVFLALEYSFVYDLHTRTLQKQGSILLVCKARTPRWLHCSCSEGNHEVAPKVGIQRTAPEQPECKQEPAARVSHPHQQGIRIPQHELLTSVANNEACQVSQHGGQGYKREASHTKVRTANGHELGRLQPIQQSSLFLQQLRDRKPGVEPAQTVANQAELGQARVLRHHGADLAGQAPPPSGDSVSGLPFVDHSRMHQHTTLRATNQLLC
mmetsp:Transcript_137827/g.384306  ORF Transcript_137827/g.384306 Transcript_137827/m.384306 type:complete len:225 (+) Transcript_137827:377-1051(+)